MGLDFYLPTRVHLVGPVPRSQLRGQMALAVRLTSSFSDRKCAPGGASSACWQDPRLGWNSGLWLTQVAGRSSSC